ncbi:MAG: lipoprotein [Pseudomonadota bacterium]|nr:lipoprotein [Sphingomonas sp.]MDQ3482075.1 lipoprotein [Pseudomonadota bacterium]
MRRSLAAAVAALALAGCASVPDADPQSRFMARLSSLCGQAFAGRLVTSDPADADMAGKPLVMHVASCSADEVRIPFHVGDDRSRTWVITRTASGLRLKHDHRHEDGSSDAVTMYGGDTAAPGTATRQEFPVDQESIALFRANNLPRSVTNVWAVETTPSTFAYELRRAAPDNRYFRVEFDLTRPVAPPPLPWGWGT